MLNLAVTFLMAPPGEGGTGGGSLMSTVIMLGSIVAIFYFMILRPQQKRQKERERLLSALKKGDKVITSGGLHGSIAGLDDKTALVQVSDTVKMKFERSAIATVLRESDAETKESK